MYIEITPRKETRGDGHSTYEFHIAAKLRKVYNLNDELFSISGNVVFANLGQVRKFVNHFNKIKNEADKIKVSEINAAGLIDEIFHYVIRKYEEEQTPNLFKRAIAHIENLIGKDKFVKIQLEFIELFPSVEVYKGKQLPIEYLASNTGDKPNKEIVLEEMLLLFLANRNSANKKLEELFSEDYFSDKQKFVEVINALNTFLVGETSVDDIAELSLIDYLLVPIKSKPDSLTEQLEFIVRNWNVDIKTKFLDKVFLIGDLLKEEIVSDGSYDGESPTIVPQYKKNDDFIDDSVLGESSYNYTNDINTIYDEPESFTPDTAWMPNVILMAKNIYVWLNQLSKKYRQGITTLDQIPDAELDELARRNINGLWLIGLWERSNASKKIKNLMGNNDAVASAYSLYDYRIANDIGGEEAYNNLNERVKARGIRLASDMVPNHTGIDSDWVRNHPDYFVQVSEPPFNYTFNGADLSDDPNIEIKIDDGYWSNSDAAVVFRRIDKRYNDVRYIYHGNDGTNMPWNDTAQLDMLKHEVREAVIQKIFDVARKFSIIRFDAAMTLAKKHFQRLWYPQPGTGGDIASRTDFSMSRTEFDDFFPVEFWREVVDRINSEMPETLLLAEAFWLMEGYFVRTLGMHRVYNSAFMNMMMKEENEKYRELIYNTLEFEPEILKRYVNFMSNPDEKTAIEQFGSDDKYFGVLTLMITLPGLPMFAHGQIEGYTEKYGMEYQRAYYDETPNTWLVDRHEREIFPLTRKRYLFSEVENFWFYDFYDLDGNLNDNVFIYSNCFNEEKTLTLFNNNYDRAYGNFQISTPKLIKINNDTKVIKKLNIAETLGISGEDDVFCILKDFVTNLEYLYKGSELCQSGFYFELSGFERRVYTGIKYIKDVDGRYSTLYTKIKGEGVHSISEMLEDEKFAEVYNTFEKIFTEGTKNTLLNLLAVPPLKKEQVKTNFESVIGQMLLFTKEISATMDVEISESKLKQKLTKKLEVIKTITIFCNNKTPKGKNKICKHNFFVLSNNVEYDDSLNILLAWLLLSPLKSPDNTDEIIGRILKKSFRKVLSRNGKEEKEIVAIILLVELLLEDFEVLLVKNAKNKTITSKQKDVVEFLLTNRSEFVSRLFEDSYVHRFLEVNLYKNIRYFNKEKFEIFVKWLLNILMVKRLTNGKDDSATILNLYCKVYEYLIVSAEESEYKLDELEAILIHKNIK